MSELNLSSEVQFFNFAGAQIAFDFMPAQDVCKTLLILVNGYQRTRSDFRAFRNRLAKLSPHTATLALDNRYCGQTVVTTNVPLSLEQMAQDAANLAEFYCKKLNLKTYSVLGISMGGMIAQVMSAKDPQKLIEKLFLVSTTAGGSERIWTETGKKVGKLEYRNPYETLESTQKNMRRYFGEKFLKSSPLLFEIMCKNLLKENQKEQGNKQVPSNAEVQFYASVNFDGIALLSHIYANTFIFSGDEDHVIPVANSTYLKDQIVRSKLYIYKEVGHLILIENPDEFAKDVATSLI